MIATEACSKCGCSKAEHAVDGTDSKGCVVTLGWCNRCFCQGYRPLAPNRPKPRLRLIPGGKSSALQETRVIRPPKDMLGGPK